MKDRIKIGKIIKIDSLLIYVQVTEDVVSNFQIKYETADFLGGIDSLVMVHLPNGNSAVAQVLKIYDKKLLNDDLFNSSFGAFILEAKLIGTYNSFNGAYEPGLTLYPIIHSEVFALSRKEFVQIQNLNCEYQILIGHDSNYPEVEIVANPDVLFGKHLAILGNTGTGKSCTLASLIQGIKRRVTGVPNNSTMRPKIIIFDTNNEYSTAFCSEEFEDKIVMIKSNELRIPHFLLNFFEYCHLLNVSPGVQSPVLKTAIKKLKNTDDVDVIKDFPFNQLSKTINQIIGERAAAGSEGNDNSRRFAHSQWYGWCSTLIERIEQLNSDQRFDCLFKADGNDATILNQMLDNPDVEIILFDLSFERDVLDIVTFLLCKVIYLWKLNNRDKSILFVLEEAHRYIKEDELTSFGLGNFYIERIAREGRKYGFSLIISSQKPSELSKIVISQCNSFIIHRISNKQDLEFIRNLLTGDERQLLELLPGLQKQHAVSLGEAFGFPSIFKVCLAEPTPESKDPDVMNRWLLNI